MSLHSSLKSDRYKPKRNVRKRYERIQALLEKGKEVLTAFALPKEKIIRLKVKKDKKEETETLTNENLGTYAKEAEKKAKKKSKDIGKIK